MIDEEPVGASRSSRRRWRSIYTALLVLVLGYFAYRGPYRCFTRGCPDLPVFYASGIAWVSGENPYDAAILNRILLQHEGASHPRSQMLINPPCSLPWFSLLSFSSYAVANLMVVFVNLLLVPAIAWMLLRLFVDQALTGWRRAIFVLFVLSWAPLHTSVSQGQNTLLAMAILLGGVGLVQCRRQYLAGVVFAAGCMVRPSFFVVMIVWYLFDIRRYVRLGGSAIIIAFSVSVIAVVQLERADVPWQKSLSENIEAFSGDGYGLYGEGTGSISPDRPTRFIMLNLQPLLSTWWGRGPLTNYAPLAIVGAGVAVAWWLHRRRVNGQTQNKMELIDLSILCVLTLLPVYNRFYAAVLLLVPLAWALAAWHCPRCRWFARAITLALMVFLIPGTAMMLRLLPMETLQSWWMNAIFLPHQIYCIIFVLVLLFLASARMSSMAGTTHSRSLPLCGL